MYAGIGKNKDDSSSFITFDILQLHQVLPESIYAERGYFGTVSDTKAEEKIEKVETVINGRTGNATSKQISFLNRLASDNSFRFVNKDILTKTEASHLIDYLKNDENKKDIEAMKRIMASGMFNSLSTFLSVS